MLPDLESRIRDASERLRQQGENRLLQEEVDEESVAKVGVDQTPELMLTVADPDAPLDELHWRDDDGTDAGDGSDDAGERRSA